MSVRPRPVLCRVIEDYNFELHPSGAHLNATAAMIPTVTTTPIPTTINTFRVV
jgi:hypothetical protein